MVKPVILVVDDDHEVLNAVERDLRQRYRQTYRIMTSSSGQQALETARELKRRGSQVALFLVDQRMPEMSGTELLTELRALYPDTKRALLTAYADTEAAIAAINLVGLDYYLLKPWDPPEDRLYPVLDDLMADWAAHTTIAFGGVRVVGSRWSPQSFSTRDFLSRNQVPYQWVDLEQDAEMRALITSAGDETPRLPVVFLADGTMLVAPTNSELAQKVGMQTVAVRPFYDLVIIGAGPAGLACAVYGASEGLKVLLIEQNAPGGQAGTSSMIENYLGFPNGVTGADLARRAATQAKRFGAEVLVSNAATALRREDPYRIVELSNGTEVACHALMLSSGMAAVKELEVPGVSKLLGAGVYYGAALSEAAMYRGQHVYVLGGANSAGQGALFFSRYAERVTLIVRKPTLGSQMSQYLVDRIALSNNI
ncbi:MAG: FAD-dependent oxidoreductase, partial [bacterium]